MGPITSTNPFGGSYDRILPEGADNRAFRRYPYFAGGFCILSLNKAKPSKKAGRE
jgi:hypothetical protein